MKVGPEITALTGFHGKVCRANDRGMWRFGYKRYRSTEGAIVQQESYDLRLLHLYVVSRGVLCVTAMKILAPIALLFLGIACFAQNSPARSNSTADDVAATVRQLRRTYMLPTLTQIEDKAVAAEACHIAAQDAQWALIGGEIPKSKWGEDHGIAFLLPASKEAQKQLERIATSDGYRRIKRFSVGICHSTSPNHPGGADWVAVAFYIGKFEAVIEKPQSF